MSKIFACAFALFILIAGEAAFAQGVFSKLEFRGGLTAGVWQGTFNQSGLGASTSLTSSNALGIGGSAGISGGENLPVFLELSIVNFGAKSGTKNANEASYSDSSFNLGYTSHSFPFEFYLGMCSGSYKFASGTEDSFQTKGYLAGINWFWRFQPTLWAGLKGEYRMLNSTRDSNGNIPADYTTKFTLPFLGVFVQLVL
jgi:hypothetical protein